MSWFTEVEEVEYSVVEFIRGVGTIYSLKRPNIAYNEHDWLSHWQSLANFLKCSIRDIILLGELTKPNAAVILQTMAETVTNDVIDIYHFEPKLPEVKVRGKLDTGVGHVLVAESSGAHNRTLLFQGKAKGVHHFHRAAFTGILTHPKYAPNGQKIRLDIRHGLYDGAPVAFSWRWTLDAAGNTDSVDVTLGFIELKAGTPTEFVMAQYKGAGWGGYPFSGRIMSKDQIIARTTVGHTEFEIDFRRVPGT